MGGLWSPYFRQLHVLTATISSLVFIVGSLVFASAVAAPRYLPSP